MDGVCDVACLREDHVFQFRLVGAESVHGSDALYGGVEFFEEFVGDAGGDFGAVAPAQHIFVGHDDAMRFADRCGDGFPIVGRERTQVDDFDGDAFAKQLGGGYFGAMNERAIGDDAYLDCLL